MLFRSVLHTGGDGGSVNNYFQADNSGQIIQQIVAGNGGNATGLGGVGGNGGSVNGINTLGDIGLFDGTTFGVNGMGGIFAGVGGHGENSVTFGKNGNVTNVTADRIASIVAGTSAGPVAVNFVDNITVRLGSGTNSATTLGANTDGTTDPAEFILPAFDFLDANGNTQFDLGADPLHDPSEVPIDGLVLANVIGSINVPSRDPSLTLFRVETSSGTIIGNIDPQVP